MEFYAVIQSLVLSVSLAVVISAICSLCEAVLYSISVSQVEMLKKSGHASAEHLQNLKSDIDEPITALLTLNTIAHTIGAWPRNVKNSAWCGTNSAARPVRG